ncbi:hypothetical protein B0J13DRAFT_61382 [Dactylonectria estremocensis]|uniref:Uncharacterized protein n=1 Tax=Dactylonectria estremocensis TaxID=1079267 RepID=A0A9P9EMC1_9HYPO|nr:hypothetical protein B0J13DRAFT_61382 [Dactylonectria estremocensis]
MAVQPGDIINFGKLAWDIYRYGWSDDLNATKQYNEFGRDVKYLAESLDILTRVVAQANSSLQRQGGYNAVARWDRSSLGQIIGDYQATLRECHELLGSNERYRIGSNPLRNIEWNVLVQPTADQLRQRISLHNSKILHVLKPFEIDLLCRVRQDIQHMHHDIVQRISAVHHDIYRIMGVLVPDLEQALHQQAQRHVTLIDVPIDMAERFRFEALTDRPEYCSDAEFELEELSDAFILNFNKGTINFQSGMIVAERIPPIDQYVNLLKCVWLLKRIQQSPPLQNATHESHWPSYVHQLEDDISSQCTRFGQELVKPDLIPPMMRRDMFSIWPEREPTPLVPVVTGDELMEQLLEVPLQSPAANVEQKAKLLRRMGEDGRRFRILITGTEQTASGRPRRQTEVIDFDISSVIINPQYALPNNPGMIREMILRRDERIARMSFTKLSHVLKFQQAITGFKPYESFTQYNAMVSFVIVGRKDPLIEKASIQLWIPKEVEGSLVTSSDAAAEVTQVPSPSRTGSMATSNFGAMPTSPVFGREAFTMSPSPFRMSGDRLSTSPPSRQPGLQTIPQRQPPSPGFFNSSWQRQDSPTELGTTPPNRQSFMGMQSPVRRPVGQPPSSRRSSTLATTMSNTTNGTSPGRSLSISSTVSTSAVSNTSNSSGSDVRSTTISTGTNTTGLLHRRPPKPMLVLFTQNPQDGKSSFVTIQIDEETSVNPDRCNCRRSGREGTMCPIAAIERRGGDANLAARRYESTSLAGKDMDWNIARLALSNPVSTSNAATWEKLKRLSIMFPDPSTRAAFGGTPNQCRCKVRTQGELTNCLNSGHKGLWGRVQEVYRRQASAYHQVRYGAQQQVVNGLMTRE